MTTMDLEWWETPDTTSAPAPRTVNYAAGWQAFADLVGAQRREAEDVLQSLSKALAKRYDARSQKNFSEWVAAYGPAEFEEDFIDLYVSCCLHVPKWSRSYKTPKAYATWVMERFLAGERLRPRRLQQGDD